MEAEKSHNLPSASWKPKKSGGVIQYDSQCLPIKEAKGVNLSPKAGEDELRCLSSAVGQEQRAQILSPSTFCSIQGLRRLNDVHQHSGEQFL